MTSLPKLKNSFLKLNGLLRVACKVSGILKCFKIYVGVTLFGGPKASPLLNIPMARSLHLEYNSLTCTIEVVDDVYAAIDHINLYGRHGSLYL